MSPQPAPITPAFVASSVLGAGHQQRRWWICTRPYPSMPMLEAREKISEQLGRHNSTPHQHSCIARRTRTPFRTRGAGQPIPAALPMEICASQPFYKNIIHV